MHTVLGKLAYNVIEERVHVISNISPHTHFRPTCFDLWCHHPTITSLIILDSAAWDFVLVCPALIDWLIDTSSDSAVITTICHYHLHLANSVQFMHLVRLYSKCSFEMTSVYFFHIFLLDDGWWSLVAMKSNRILVPLTMVLTWSGGAISSDYCHFHHYLTLGYMQHITPNLPRALWTSPTLGHFCKLAGGREYLRKRHCVGSVREWGSGGLQSLDVMMSLVGIRKTALTRVEAQLLNFASSTDDIQSAAITDLACKDRGIGQLIYFM